MTHVADVASAVAEVERAVARVDSLVGDDRVTFPDGLTVEYADDGFTVRFDTWATTWRNPAPNDRQTRIVEWDANWGLDTLDAAANHPDDVHVARMLAEDVMVAAMQAAAHEMFELCRLDGRWLWAEPHRRGAANGTRRTLGLLRRMLTVPGGKETAA